MDQSDLLLECSAGSVGGCSSGGCLDRLVGHDARGELCLGLLKAGPCGAVHTMYLKKLGGGREMRGRGRGK